MRVKYILMLVALIVLMAPAVYAVERFAVEGYVFEKDLGEPLPNASIYCYSLNSIGGFMTKTDQNGFYHIVLEGDIVRYGQYPFRVMALVAYGRPNPIFTSQIAVPYASRTVIPSPNIADGYIYHRDLYIDVKGQYQGRDPS